MTGASSGIGLATARALAAAGMRVALAARRVERLQALAGELRAGGAEVLALSADMRDEGQIMAMFRAVRETWGGVDALVTCAGLSWYSPIADAETRNWQDMLDVNVLGTAICLREGVREMAGRDPAQIVAISSLAAYRVPVGLDTVFYSATKHALRALVEGLRSELVAQGSRMKLGMVSPGQVRTEFQSRGRGLDQRGEQYDYKIRVLDPEDVADAVCFLLSTPPQVQVQDIQMRSIQQLN
ncbi:MAG: SDR family NAD(P)-dependent oxidoreductase [Candidatus Lambdaproteobacteria bacterium]|nr:SDR family NAD(P)-dependent oxidoreductase [Candidatus Lambdaproteobacteria bacterium]